MKINIPFRDRNQMTMKEKIANPLSVEEALELGKESIIPITDYWETILVILILTNFLLLLECRKV